MSDPEVPQPEQPHDVDHVVDSANAGLDAAAAAGADVPDAAEPTTAPAVDPDLAAFEAAEKDHPGVFSAPASVGSAAAADTNGAARFDAANTGTTNTGTTNADAANVDASRADAERATAYTAPVVRDAEDYTLADDAYAQSSDNVETTIVAAEPVIVAAAAPVHPQPIFVQAPEEPRDRGNRGTAGAIGLLATLAFAILYLGATIGLGAIYGDVTGENIGEAALAPLATAGFWTPVVVFFLGFWLLGSVINRGRWGLWVVFGIVVGVIAYGGHILGQLFEAPFWEVSASAGLELVGEQLLAPLAIAAFVFARELTIWFGAWVARSGARKTELNLEAQREYERTLEAGPTLSR